MTKEQQETPRRRRAAVAAVGALVVLAVGTGGWLVLDARGQASSASADQVRRHQATAPVTEGDLTESTTLAGTLGYGEPVAMPGAAHGTLTWLPTPGQVVRRDDRLYAVDERPVRVLYGAVPLWRTLRTGLEGEDVRQLNENLHALGYDVAVDAVFGHRTLAAVRAWQADRHLERTGRVTADDVVFVDGEVRVASVAGVLGQQPGPDLLSVTSTERVVRAVVPQQDADAVAVGTAVTVRVNGAGDTMRGEVVDSAPEEAQDGGAPEVAVTITFDAGARELPAAASAQVVVPGRSEQGVLSVPVSALVAGDGGRYAVDVVRADGTTKRVRVEAGFVAEGRVAVTGGVREGDRVVVPS